MDVGFKTDKGIARYNNEDACFVMVDENVFIIADGVGGNRSGEIASRTATRLVSQYISSKPIEKNKGEEYIKDYFNGCIAETNLGVFQLGQKFDENFGMATTIVIGYIEGSKLYIFNIGDSRAYLYRDGVIRQITEDHTYVNTLVKAGVISKEAALVHEKKNVITRALGAEAITNADAFTESLQEDDVIIMCTDGLYGEVSEREMVEVFKKGYNMSQTCSNLVELANLNGGGDNITIICLKFTKEDNHEQ